jgi:hypothetical protein
VACAHLVNYTAHSYLRLYGIAVTSLYGLQANQSTVRELSSQSRILVVYYFNAIRAIFVPVTCRMTAYKAVILITIVS